MRERFLTLFAIPLLVAGVAAQTPAKKPAPAGGIPRMADGHPDLQGTYDGLHLHQRPGRPLRGAAQRRL